MGKKRCRKAYTSKGQRPNVKNGTLKLARDGVSNLTKYLNKIRAWKQGKNPWVTLYDPNRPSNVRYYKVRANNCWGNPKNNGANVYKREEE